MNKFEITQNKSLVKSLKLLNHLLIKSLNFHTSATILTNEQQIFLYPENSKIGISHYNQDDLERISFKKEVCTSTEHLSTGFATEVKHYLSTPLISSTGNQLGAVVLTRTKTQTFTTEEISTLSHFAQITANIIEKDLENQTIQQTFTDFIHKTIHDLKNPLTSIALTAELLKKKSENPKMVVSFSDKLKKTSKRLFSNLEDLKTIFPLAEQSSFKLSVGEINLSILLNDIKSSCPATHINIKKDTLVVIYGHYSRLKQAITQLIIAKNCDTFDIELYTRENNIEIKISSTETTNFSDTAFLIGKLLIEMHGGKTENQENSYIIRFPLDKS